MGKIVANMSMSLDGFIAGLLDEIHLHLIPVLLGEGIRLFDNLGAGYIELERTKVTESPEVTHLTFGVVK